ncbi:MAG: nitrile hydratase subunit alpha [Rhodospirillaceae bacterium]|jgi:nitrile hydratase
MASHDHGDHDHEHDHDKTFQPDEEESLGHYGIAEMAVRELLLERGVFTEDEFRSKLEKLDSITPALGAKVIARAWTDPDFKKRLLENGSEAVKDFGVEMGSVELYVVENTPNVHNVIVCTLCSCYPRPLLGAPPDWYKSRNYRSRTVREPRKVLQEFGTAISDDIEVRVHDSAADLRYLVLPMRPSGTEDYSEEQLEELVNRDSMIGVTEIKFPQ